MMEVSRKMMEAMKIDDKTKKEIVKQVGIYKMSRVFPKLMKQLCDKCRYKTVDRIYHGKGLDLSIYCDICEPIIKTTLEPLL